MMFSNLVRVPEEKNGFQLAVVFILVWNMFAVAKLLLLDLLAFHSIGGFGTR